MKIHPVGAEVLHDDGQTVRHDEANSFFRNFSKAPNNESRFAVENKLTFLRVRSKFIKTFSRNKESKGPIMVEFGYLINYQLTCKVNRVVIFNISLSLWLYPFQILSRKNIVLKIYRTC
jgi:hypothetical protein